MHQIDNIPEQYQPGFIALQELNNKIYFEFLDAIEKSKANSNLSDYKDIIISNIKNGDENNLNDIIDSLISLYMLKADYKFDNSKLLGDVLNVIIENKIEGLNNEDAEITKLENRLKELLEIESFNKAVNAYKILNENENIFCKAKFITEFRPVFNDNTELNSLDFVIFSKLKIRYHYDDEGNTKEIYLSLDNNDIANLKKSLDAEITRIENLKDFANNKKLNIIDSGENE